MKNFIATLATLIVIALLIFFSFKSLSPSSPNPSSLETLGFSTERAFNDVKQLAQKPHFIGTKAHSKTRNYITQELQAMGLHVQTQKGYDLNNSGVLTVPENIITKLPGSSPTPGSDLLILAHYDSAVHSSYGASDDASGVATVLESLRTFLHNKTKHTNTIIVCFTDAEEVGLNGADLFVKYHPWAKDIGLVVNFEARGTAGPSNTIIETNHGNQKLVDAFSQAEPAYPLANSLMYSIYKMLPNDTDATVFREERDIPSFFFAFIDNHFFYHTGEDTPKNLDKRSLAHQATYLMAMLPYFGNLDLNSLHSTKDNVYFNFPGISMVSYSFGWIYPMLLLAWILFLLLIVYGFHKKRIDKKMLVKGISAFLISLIASVLLVIIGWMLIKGLNPQYQEIQQGFTINGHQYIAAFVSLSIGILCLVYHHYFSWENTPGLIIAPLFFWLLINTGIAFFFKGAAYFIIPVFFALLSMFIMIKIHRPTVYLMMLLGVPAIFIFAPLIQFFPVGLGLNIMYVSAALTVMLFGLLLPVFGYIKNKKWMGYSALLVCLIFLISAQFSAGFSEENKKPNSLVYMLDIDTQNASWNTYDYRLDEWTSTYITNEQKVTKSNFTYDNKYNASFTYSAPALVKAIPAADFFVRVDSTQRNINRYDLKIVPLRNVNRMEIFSPDIADFSNIRMNGLKMKKNIMLSKSHTKKILNNKLLTYYAVDKDTLRIQFTTKKGLQPNLILFEASNDLLNNPWIEVSARKKTMMPKPFVLNDAIITKQAIHL